MSDEFNPDNGKIDNVQEFLETSLFKNDTSESDDPKVEEKSDTDIQNISRDMTLNILDQLTTSLKKCCTIHIKHYLDKGHLGNFNIANSLRTLIEELDNIDNNIISDKQKVKIDIEYDFYYNQLQDKIQNNMKN